MTFLRAFLLFARCSGFCPRPQWTQTDAENLTRFLQTGTGAKLRLTLLSEIAAANERAAFKAQPFDCGWACGYRGLWAWFEALSAPARADESSDSKADPFGEDATLDHLAP